MFSPLNLIPPLNQIITGAAVVVAAAAVVAVAEAAAAPRWQLRLQQRQRWHWTRSSLVLAEEICEVLFHGQS